MSEQKQRVFINGVWALEKVFNDGGSIIKLSILPQKFIDSIKSLKVDENGFARVVISKSKNPRPNSTHFLYEDDFVPSQSNKPAPAKSSGKSKRTTEKEEELI